jgi:hypothetical protein
MALTNLSRNVRYAFAAQPPLPYAEIELVVEQFQPVGAHIQLDRHGVKRIDAAADGVQRQLANRDGQATVALIADAENGRGVGGDDHPHIVPGKLRTTLAARSMLSGENDSPRGILVQMAELLHRLTDGRGVDDRHHFFEMPFQQGVKQGFSPFLQGAQILVFGDRIGFAQEAAVDPLDLLLQGINLRRQQTIQPQATRSSSVNAVPLLLSTSRNRAMPSR